MIKRRPYRSYLSYIDLSREFYAAHGYAKPYKWSSHQYVPFTKLEKPLADCRVALLTTTDLEKLPGESLQERHLSRKVYAQPVADAPEHFYTLDLQWDKTMQRSIMDMALELLQYAWQPRTTVQAPFIWSEDETWRKTFMQVSEEQREAYKKAGEARRVAQAKVKGKLRNKD